MNGGTSHVDARADAFASGRLSVASVGVPPTPQHHVSRARLFSLLDNKRQITMIVGTGGFGKSTLVSGWVEQRPPTAGRVAWMALDDVRGDPHLFLTQWIAAIRLIQPDGCEAALSMLSEVRRSNPRDIAASVLNDIAVRPVNWTFVFDDYPTHDRKIDALIGYAGDRLPHNVSVIIIARGEPSLPLARWRVKQKLTELGVADLRFTRSETQQLVSDIMRIPLDAESLGLLETRTEGWAAGLQLAAVWLRSHPSGGDKAAVKFVSFDGQHRFVADYLANEIFANLDDETRHFLLATALVDRFTVPLCNALLDGESSEAVLGELLQRGLFVVALDERNEWYRYHHLFQEFLQTRLAPSNAVDVHRRASIWFERAGHTGEAIKHAQAGGNTQRTISIIKANVNTVLANGEFHDLLYWLEKLPEEVVRQDAELSGYKAWLLYLNGRVGEAEVYSDMIAANDEPLNDGEAGPLAAFKAFLAINRGRIKEAERAASAALDDLTGSSSFFNGLAMLLLGGAQRISGDRSKAMNTLRATVRLAEMQGNLMVRLEAISDLVPLMYGAGKLREAMRLCETAIAEAATNPRGFSAAGLLHVRLAQLLYEMNQLDHAQVVLERGLDLCRSLGNMNYSYLGKRQMARLVYAKGEHERARELLAEAAQFADRAEHSRQHRLINAVAAEFLLREGNMPAAANLLGTGMDWAGESSAFEQLVYIRLLLTQDRPRIADSYLCRMEVAAREDGRLGILFTVLLLRALSAEARDDKGTAERITLEALALCGPAGYIRSVVDLDMPIAKILRRVEQRSGYAKLYLEHFDRKSEASLQASTRPDQGLLTGAEYSILRLLAKGMSNRDIARRLDITVGTAKWHVHNVYQKLEASGRMDAVFRARELQLLED